MKRGRGALSAVDIARTDDVITETTPTGGWAAVFTPENAGTRHLDDRSRGRVGVITEIAPMVVDGGKSR